MTPAPARSAPIGRSRLPLVQARHLGGQRADLPPERRRRSSSPRCWAAANRRCRPNSSARPSRRASTGRLGAALTLVLMVVAVFIVLLFTASAQHQARRARAMIATLEDRADRHHPLGQPRCGPGLLLHPDLHAHRLLLPGGPLPDAALRRRFTALVWRTLPQLQCARPPCGTRP